jgi:hypothetical protein
MILHPQNSVVIIIYTYISLTGAVVASSGGDFFSAPENVHVRYMSPRWGGFRYLTELLKQILYSYIYVWRYYIMYIYVRVCARTPRLNPREHGTFRLPFLRFVFFVPGNRFLKTIIIPCNNLDRTYGFRGFLFFPSTTSPHTEWELVELRNENKKNAREI